jgi:hypothetical protein
MLLFHFLISLVLVGFVAARTTAELVENANFQLFAGQFAVEGTEGDSEAAVDAKIRSPWSIWGDNHGLVYFSDPKSHTIRVVATSSGKINLFAGAVDTYGAAVNSVNAASAKFNRPHGLYGDPKGLKLWVCDTLNHVVREIDISNPTSTVTTIGKLLSFLVLLFSLFPFVAGQNGVQGYSGDHGQASSAVLHAPVAVYWDITTGRKFITEVHKCTIRMIDASGVITTIAGTAGTCGMDVDGVAVSSKLFKPFALSMDSLGHLLIADYGNNRVVQLTIGGNLVTIAGKGLATLGATEGDEDLAVNAHVSSPSGIWVDRHDNIFIAESLGHRVRQIKASDGKIYNTIGKVEEKGTLTSLWHPRGIWGDDTFELKLFVPDSLNHRIVTIQLASPEPSSFPSSRPSLLPSAVPSGQPSDHPSSEPSSFPSSRPSLLPSSVPSAQPSDHPSSEPSSFPSSRPSLLPSAVPSAQPSDHPSSEPSSVPSSHPSLLPSSVPSAQPSDHPSSEPSSFPSSRPSLHPSSVPSARPSDHPSSEPSSFPSSRPSLRPSSVPSAQPSDQPSSEPSSVPSSRPSLHPSSVPSAQPSDHPSSEPSSFPSSRPSLLPSSVPSAQPSDHPSSEPSSVPSSRPSLRPSSVPSAQPSDQPSSEPSSFPSSRPSLRPSSVPSARPSDHPSSQPSSFPSSRPSLLPSADPSAQPSDHPSSQPSSFPSSRPSLRPSSVPSGQPSDQPSSEPSSFPSSRPSLLPSSVPSAQPSDHPSSQPSSSPSSRPSLRPSSVPSAQPSDHPSSQPSSSPSYVAPSFAVISVFAGDGSYSQGGEDVPAALTPTVYPYGVWVDSNDNVYFSSSYYSNIRKVGTDGKVNTIAGNSRGNWGFQDAVKGTNALFWVPRGIHGNGNFLVVGDFNNNRIRMVDLTTSDHTVTTIVGGCSTGCTTDYTGTHAGNLWTFGQTYSPFIDGNYLYFTDYNSHVLLRTDLLSISYDTKVFYGTYNYPNVNGLYSPAYLYVTSQGTSKSIYVTEDQYGQRILKLNLDTTSTSVSSFETVMGVYNNGARTADTSDSRGQRVLYPRGVWVDESSNLLYYCEKGSGNFRTIDMANGYALKTFAGVPYGSSYSGPYDTTAPTTALLGAPSGIFGKGSKIYFTDQNQNLIRLVTLHPASTSKGIHTHLRRI